MADKLLEDAMRDAKLLKKTAIENAKNTLVEAISPQIKEFVNSQLGESDVTLEMPIYEDEEEGEEMNFGKEDEDETPEEGMYSEGGGLMEMDLDPDALRALADKLEQLKGGDHGEHQEEALSCDDDEGEEMKENQEVVEITEEDLKEAFTEVLQGIKGELSEAQVPNTEVSKAFGDQENPNALAKGGLGEKAAPGERGLEDKEKEEMWKDHEPPAGQDWSVHSVNEQLKKKLKSLQQENASLRNGVKELRRNLVEVNLFNSKLLYTNKLLNSAPLTNEQRLRVVEAFDRANNLREVELVYKSLSESLQITGVLGEGKVRRSKAGKGSRTLGGSLNQELLRESANKDGGPSRWQVLAGLVK